MQLQEQRPGESALRNGDKITIFTHANIPGQWLENYAVWVVWADQDCMMVSLDSTAAAGAIRLDFGTEAEGVNWLHGHGDEVDQKSRRALEVARALTALG